MSWAVGHDSKHGGRHIGYGIVAYCDHPDCNETIDRGLAHVCAQEQPYGGENGCGLYFCGDHLAYHEDKDHQREGFMCERCDEFHTRMAKKRNKDYSFEPFDPKPEHPIWIEHVLKDSSWKKWRLENKDEVKRLRGMLKTSK